jgi:NitT/TauT family transport system ATP-binding protein
MRQDDGAQHDRRADRADRGVVLVNDAPARCPNMDVSYMYARDALLPWRSARRNVELALDTRELKSGDRRARARQMLDLVGLLPREDYYPLQLSKGMRQRVALARTLAPSRASS